MYIASSSKWGSGRETLLLWSTHLRRWINLLVRGHWLQPWVCEPRFKHLMFGGVLKSLLCQNATEVLHFTWKRCHVNRGNMWPGNVQTVRGKKMGQHHLCKSEDSTGQHKGAAASHHWASESWRPPVQWCPGGRNRFPRQSSPEQSMKECTPEHLSKN